MLLAETNQGLKLVAIGGGTGLSTLLAGLKQLVGASDGEGIWLENLSAIVTVSDDGGSSGRLRDELQMLPPGDIRNCMVALSEDSTLLSRLFRHRFRGSGELGGHSFGNLFLAALTEVTGDFVEAVRLSSEVLASKGRIYPATINDVRLVAELEDGSEVRGETQITASLAPIRRLRLEPEQCLPLPEALTAIRAADVITIGPGSLYTSILPNLLVARVAQAIGQARAIKIFICNLMTQPGETDGYTARQHLETVKSYAPEIAFDYVILNNHPISPEQTALYAADGAYQIGMQDHMFEKAFSAETEVVRADLLDEGEKVRHNPDKFGARRLGLLRAGAREPSDGCPVLIFMEKQTQFTMQDAPAPLDVLILAAGLGTRMRSRTAKVMHQLGGRPIIAHVCRAAAALTSRPIHVIVGHQAEQVEAAVREELDEHGATFITQAQQRGTGDAVMAARDALADAGSTILVLSGDVPLVRAETLGALIQQHRAHRGRGAACTMLTVRLEDPTGYGRIVRDEEGRFQKIVEQKVATPEERQIKEINAGIYCFETRALFSALARVQPANAQGEYYLTDVPGILRADGEDVSIFLHGDAREVSGINTRVELAEFERILRQRTLRRLMLDSGVTFIDPAHTYVSAEAQVGRDCVIYPDVHIEGNTIIGDDCEIRSGTRITSSRIGNGVQIKDHCVIVESEVSDGCTVGPSAHLRMNAKLEEGAAVGNFVEMKKSRLGRKSKAMHLTYLGDATIGEKTNIGAGTITCNYDGKDKHATVIEDEVKIGSDTMLVAPVRIGRNSVTGAGSVVTRDVPPDTLVAGVPAVVKKRLGQNQTNEDESRKRDKESQTQEVASPQT